MHFLFWHICVSLFNIYQCVSNRQLSGYPVNTALSTNTTLVDPVSLFLTQNLSLSRSLEIHPYFLMNIYMYLGSFIISQPNTLPYAFWETIMYIYIFTIYYYWSKCSTLCHTDSHQNQKSKKSPTFLPFFAFFLHFCYVRVSTYRISWL